MMLIVCHFIRTVAMCLQDPAIRRVECGTFLQATRLGYFLDILRPSFLLLFVQMVWLSTGSEDGIINVWDIGTGKRLKQMRGHGKNAIYSLSYSKEGNVLISGGADHTVRVWDLKKATTEPSAEPDEPFIGYLGDVTASINQDIKEYGRRRTVIPTSDLVASFYTKKTPVFKVKFSRSNLALAGGAFRP